MTDKLVKDAQDVFLDVWTETGGDDGWVGLELDPLLEDGRQTKSTADRAAAYVELGRKWAAGHANRMIRVPATPGALGAVEQLVAVERLQVSQDTYRGRLHLTLPYTLAIIGLNVL